MHGGGTDGDRARRAGVRGFLNSGLLEKTQSDEKTRLHSDIDYGIQRAGC